MKVNTVDHNTFQENINNYLQGKPDDVFTWFAGYRMQFFAAARASPATSATCGRSIGGNFSDAFKKASTGDGRQAVLRARSTYYPWAVFYRKSVLQQHGYRSPKTLDEFNDARRADEEGRPRPRSPSPTRTAGRRWAPSTSSTCASTATTSTST